MSAVDCEKQRVERRETADEKKPQHKVDEIAFKLTETKSHGLVPRRKEKSFKGEAPRIGMKYWTQEGQHDRLPDERHQWQLDPGDRCRPWS